MRIIILFLVQIIFLVSSIAQPSAGYYNNAANKSCATLKTALKNIINNGISFKTYTELWGQYLLTDIKQREVGTGSSQVIWDMYSDNPNGLDPYNFTPGTGSGGQQDQGSGGNSEGDKYNREHSVPQSWFSGNTGTPGPTTDYHHIFPTDKYVNNRRGNLPYGEVANVSQTFLNGSKMGSSAVAGISGNVFEPINEYKGDFARAFLYFVTMYESEMAGYSGNTENAQAFEFNTFPSVKINYLKLMIKWHNQDPVSDKERARNNGGFLFQGNRNPFVDSPQYVQQIWNGSCPGLSVLPANISLFTGKLSNQLVQLQWDVLNEINLKGYAIEKSVNGMHFNTVGFVEAVGNKTYQFTVPIDQHRGQRMYFRLKKVDIDGSIAYTETIQIHIPSQNSYQLYPNPVNNQLQITLQNNVTNKLIRIQLIDISGKIVFDQQQTPQNNQVTISTKNIQNGFYVVQITDEAQRISKTIQIQH
ncbi:MAG: endonuclease [Chitinophagaceae bacterium]